MTRAELCSCIKCTKARAEKLRAEGAPFHMTFPGPGLPGWSYGCAKCGNKRCPHHSDHERACTNSNKSGQPGSIYQ